MTKKKSPGRLGTGKSRKKSGASVDHGVHKGQGASELEDQYRLIADNTADFEFLADPQGRFIYASPSCLAITGYSPEEFLAAPGLLRSIIRPEDLPAYDRHRSEVKKRIAGRVAWRLVKKDGSVRWISHICQPVFSPSGNYLGERGSNRDITERMKIEETLRESEEKFARIFQNNAAAITLTRLRDGTILDVNKKWHKVFGYSRREVIGKNSAAPGIRIWKNPEQRKHFYKELAARKSVQNFECQLFRKNGEEWTALISSEVIQLQGEPVVIGFLQDITALKRVEEENRSLAKFPSENPNPVLRLTPESLIIYCNAAAQNVLGPGKGGQGITIPQALRRVIRQAFISRSRKTIESAIKDRIYIFDVLPFPKLGYVNIYGRDETEHRRDEEALRASEQRYHSLFDKMNEGFALHEIICDKKGVPVDYRFLEINPAFEELTGLRRKTVLGRRHNELLPGDSPRWIKVYGKVALTGKPVQFENYSPVLKRHYNVIAFSPARGQFAVLFTDISEQRGREVELRTLNRTLKALSNSTQAMMQATNEQDYLREICRIIVRDCGHRMAWIGYSENDKEKSVRPVVHSGFERGYTKTLNITWADKERGRGPTGTAIRTGKPVICPNMMKDLRFAPWREEARRRGYVSSLAIPLLADGRAFGALTIYSQEADPFLPSEVELLLELAERLAYGIRALRLRQEHALAEEALRVSLTKYQVLFDSFPLGISITDEKGNVIESNRQAERLLGVPKEEHEKRKVDSREWKLVSPDSKPMHRGQFASVRALKEKRLVENVEMGVVKGEGNITWINVSAAPIPLKGFGVAVTYGDISDRKRIEEALRETSNYLDKLLNYANAPIIVWDPRFRVVRFNHAFERLTGYDAARVCGKPLDMLFPAASKNASLQLIQDTLEGRHWEVVEIPIMQKGGAIRTVLWNSANIQGQDGRVVATIAQGQDISERKLTEKQVEDSLHEKETLLRELYHRTKNNMNIISSLVALQAATVGDLNVQRMFADMQSRIRTMSLVHEKLYQSQDLSNLDMREYIGDLARTILAGYKSSAARIALDLDIESVAFSIDAAIPCGLVINELMTNSLKYAFPEGMTGRIGISLRMSPGEEATLCYKDNGIGFPDGFEPLKATSLGLKIVQNLVRKQLLGKVEFIAVQGMRAVITFKKPAAARQERP